MIPFVVVGEGRPARAVLEVILAAPQAKLARLAVDDPARRTLGAFAAARGIPLTGKSDLLAAAQGGDLADCEGAWLINANSTQLIPASVLDLFPGRALNFHPGLLPQYAGLHTHQWAIRNGEHEFGVTIHRMEQRIDTGAIVGQVRFAIRPEDTGLSLFMRCLGAGADLFAHVVDLIVRGQALPDIPQDLTQRRLYRHRDALDGRIDWNWTASGVVDFIRAGNYEPFASPTYVARLDPVAGSDIDVLHALREGPTAAPPGMLVDISDVGPAIACGDGVAIRIDRARRGRESMSSRHWRDYFSQCPNTRLLGRGGSMR